MVCIVVLFDIWVHGWADADQAIVGHGGVAGVAIVEAAGEPAPGDAGGIEQIADGAPDQRRRKALAGFRARLGVFRAR